MVSLEVQCLWNGRVAGVAGVQRGHQGDDRVASIGMIGVKSYGVNHLPVQGNKEDRIR